MSNDTSAKRNIQKLQRLIVDALEDVKGQDIQVFNTESLSPLFERVIVVSGTSNRQTRALAMATREAVKEAGFGKPRLEGEDNGEWIIVDCGMAVVHIMQPIIRQYYRLEELWGETPVRLVLAGSKRVASHAKTFAREVAAVETRTARKPPVTADQTPAKPAKAVTKKPATAPAKTAAKTTAKASPKSRSQATPKPISATPVTPVKAAAKTPAKPSTKPVAVKKIVVKASTRSRTAKPVANATRAKAAPAKAPVKRVAKPRAA